MGLSILAFACSMNAFRRVYGSHDQALYERLIHSENSSIRHSLGMSFSDSKSTEAQKTALREIIEGVALEQFDPSTYARSLIAVLHGIGDYLGSNGGSYGRQMDADAVLYQRKESLRALPQFDVRWPIGELCVPDFPQIQLIPFSDVEQNASIMRDVMSRLTEKDMGDATESAYYFLLDLRDYYNKCAELKQDMILVAL